MIEISKPRTYYYPLNRGCGIPSEEQITALEREIREYCSVAINERKVGVISYLQRELDRARELRNIGRHYIKGGKR